MSDMLENHGFGVGEVPDETLVARLVTGDRQSLGALVDRYYWLVLVETERLLGNREDAMDVCQDSFLTAFHRIGALKDPGRLRAWLVRIAQNKAKMLLRKRQPVCVAFHTEDGGIVYGRLGHLLVDRACSIPETAANNEMKALLRKQVDLLAREYAEVIRLHYFEGLSLARIAQRLGVPVGTAKSRLWQARQRLRKELMMNALTDEKRHTSVTQPLLQVSITCGCMGSDADLQPHTVAKTLLAQQILFVLRKEARTAKEIAREVKADLRYVLDHLDRLVAAELLREQDGRYRANFILFDGDDKLELEKKLSGRGKKIAEVVASHDGELKEIIARLSPTAMGIREDRLRWVILPTGVLHIGLWRALESKKGKTFNLLPQRPDGGAWVFLPSLRDNEGLEVGLGCNSGDGWANGWSPEFGIPLVEVSSSRDVMLRLAKGSVKVESLVEEFSEETIAAIIENGFVRKEDGRVVLAAPVFGPADGAMLMPWIDKVANDIVDQAYAEYPDDVYAVLDSLGFGFARSDYPVHARVIARMGALRALVDNGVLPRPPKPVPPSWGFFAWEGEFALMDVPS